MKLLSPKGKDSRPITDRVKESLFSVLYKYDLPNGKVVADLFCGTGSLGLEALSRGAEFVTFVEQDPKVVAILNRNIEKAAFVKESKVITANAFRIGAPVDSDRQGYDLVFVDPPYACTLDAGAGSRLSGLLNLVSLSGLLNLVSEHVNPSGFVVVRTNKRTELMEWYGHLRVSERREWGTMAVTILQRVDE
jgi:16S rRNA (guanine(966)-N(2))-methyltransferase RsmD